MRWDTPRRTPHSRCTWRRRRRDRRSPWARRGVRFGSAAGGRRDEAASLHDAIQRAAVDRQVLEHRKGRRTPRLQHERVAIMEKAHVQLTHRGRPIWSVRDAVDHEAARAADALTTVAVEDDRVLAAADQVLVDHVQHLEERHVLVDVAGFVRFEATGVSRAALAPDLQREVHYL